MNKLNPSKRGFTVIELSVAMTLFVIVLGVTSSIFIRSLRSQRAIVDLIAINDNMSLTLEQLAREVRLGTCFDDNAPTEELRFRNTYGQDVVYGLQNQAIQRSVGPSTQIITGENVKISRLNFILSMSPSGTDGRTMAKVTVVLGIGSASPQLEGFLTNIQTTISSRIFYNPSGC